MSRTFPNTVLRRALAASAAMPVQFLRFAFGGGELRVTTAPFDVDWDGFTWQGIGGTLRFDRLQESADDRGGQITLALSGVDQSMVSAILAEQYIGRVVEIWFGWVTVNTNLIGNSGVETNTSGYSAIGATLTRSQAVPAAEGDWVLACAMTVSAADQGLSSINNLGTDLPVTPGVEYEFAFRHRLADGSGPRDWRAYLDFYTSGIAYLGSSTAVNFIVRPGGYLEARVPATKAPATAAVCRPRVLCNGATGLYTVYFDAFQFGPAGSPLYQPTDGAPIVGGTILDRPLQVFSGYMNGGFEVTETPSERDGGSVDIEGKVVSSLASLLQPQGFRTNRESHQAVYRTDQFFEFVPGLAGKVVTWGWTKKELLSRAAGDFFGKGRGRQ